MAANTQGSAAHLSDILYVSLCLSGALISLVFFWRDLNQTLSRLTEQPLGIISYKYRASQRRFNNRLLWERLKQDSAVFDGDYIRTAELSEATVSFFDEDILIGLEENTLIQILSGGSNIVLMEGNLSADVRAGNVRINAGAAGINVSAGEVYSTAGTGSARTGTARVAVLSPGPAAKFLNNAEVPLRVPFRWNRIGFTGNEGVRLDIAEDRNFSRIVQTIESRTENTAVDLANGIYYWRAYSVSEVEAEIKQSGTSGRLSVIYGPAPALIRPEPDEVFSFKTSRPGIRFQWAGNEGANTTGGGPSAYLVEAATNRNMQDPVFRIQVQGTGGNTGSLEYSGLEPGTYYWRVTPVYSREYTGTSPVSAIASFRIERAAALVTPEPQIQKGEIYLESEQKNNYFTWKQEDDAASYTFLLSQQQDLSNPIIEQKVQDNYYAFDVKTAGLDPGQYYWGVYQTDIEGNNSGVSQARTIVIMAGAPPVRAPVVFEADPVPAVPAADSFTPEPAVPVAVATPTVVPTAVPVEQLPEPIPPLPAPQGLLPGTGHELTEEIIIRDRQISFSWEAVSEAAAYIFTLYQAAPGGNREILRLDPQRETSFTLTNLALLDRGDFVWQVEAVNLNEGRAGEIAESRFTVNIEEVEASRGNESGVIFGRE